MISPSVIGYEFRRIVFSRKYLYLLLLLGLAAYDNLTRMLLHGAFGTAPFSKVSYIKYLVMSNPMLLVTVALLCVAVFTEKELAARKILFSTPISTRAYFAMKGMAIAGACLLAAALQILYSCVYFGWQHRFFHYVDFIHPIAVFLVPPAVFVLGLSMAAGRISVKLLYGLLPLLFVSGIFNVGLPVWLDLHGNNFLLNYDKMLLQTIGSSEIVYHLPTDWLLSRGLLVVMGVVLFGVACRDTKP